MTLRPDRPGPLRRRGPRPLLMHLMPGMLQASASGMLSLPTCWTASPSWSAAPPQTPPIPPAADAALVAGIAGAAVLASDEAAPSLTDVLVDQWVTHLFATPPDLETVDVESLEDLAVVVTDPGAGSPTAGVDGSEFADGTDIEVVSISSTGMGIHGSGPAARSS